MDTEKLTVWDMFNMEVSDGHLPPKGVPARVAKAFVNSEAWTDANPVMNLSSFVTTFSEREADEVAHAHILKNYIDHDMYPQLFAMEQRMVRWLHHLWNGPAGVTPYGTATVGSSEACMLGPGLRTSGTGARRGRRRARTAAGRTWSPAATCRSSGRSSCGTSMWSRASRRSTWATTA